MTDQKKLQVLKEVSAGGNIHFTMRFGIWNWYSLSPERVLEFVQDKEAFVARVLGVSVDRLRDFLKWQEEGRPCRALTVEGIPCKNVVSESFDIDKYRPGINDRCHKHKEHDTPSNTPS